MLTTRYILDEAHLRHYDERLKSWASAQPVKTLPPSLYPWTLTDKAGAVTCWPVGGNPLKPTVDFLFTETPPASGDKGPGNPSTISGVESIQVTQTNKNLASQPYHTPTSVRQGVTWTVNADGSVTANGTATANSVFYVCGIASTNLRLPAGTKCFLSGCPSGGSDSSYFMRVSVGSGSSYASAKDLGNGTVFTITDTDTTVGVIIQITEGFTANNIVFYPQLEIGETETEWEPFTRIRVTLPLGSTYYGGSLDLATGVMTVTMGQYAFNGTENITSWTALENVGRAAFPLNTITALWGGVQACTHLPYTYTWSGDYTHFYVNMNEGQSGAIIFAPYFTQEAMKAWMASEYANGTPVTIVWTLRQPVTVQLTPTEILSLAQADKYTPRLNTIYTDAQAVQVGYIKSPIREEYELTQAIVAQGGNI